MASGTTIGGAQLAEGVLWKQVQAFVGILKASSITTQKLKLLVRRSNAASPHPPSSLPLDLQHQLPSKFEHTIVIAILSTFSAASLSSLLAITNYPAFKTHQHAHGSRPTEPDHDILSKRDGFGSISNKQASNLILTDLGPAAPITNAGLHALLPGLPEPLLGHPTFTAVLLEDHVVLVLHSLAPAHELCQMNHHLSRDGPPATPAHLSR
ncbi:hypothetical protein VP01_708g1 [Puccinia sorghi]|uniref:Uncharacterized protein n=1 Tax=Puccinia sorghi TaxID=27349 RepID=A0A0L6UEG4_9BASI|nr:hypothetical protein VP01_708g1 [Puccinia sorghi]